MDADAVGMEEVIAEIEFVQREGNEEGGEVWRVVGCAEEGEDEVWSRGFVRLDIGEDADVNCQIWERIEMQTYKNISFFPNTAALSGR